MKKNHHHWSSCVSKHAHGCSKQPQRVTPFNATTPHPPTPPPHSARAPRDANISIIKYILISRRVTHHLCALNIFVIHRRRSSAFAKTTSNKKTRRTPQKTGTALKLHLHWVELKKRKNAYDSEISGSRRFSKRTCPESTQNRGFREGTPFWPTVLSEPVWIYIYICV